MLALNYAILKYFTKVYEASVQDVINFLKKDYGDFKALNKKSVLESLMSAEINGILDKTRLDFDDNNELIIYYKVSEFGENIINKYI